MSMKCQAAGEIRSGPANRGACALPGINEVRSLVGQAFSLSSREINRRKLPVCLLCRRPKRSLGAIRENHFSTVRNVLAVLSLVRGYCDFVADL